jgi:hypothetical protein
MCMKTRHLQDNKQDLGVGLEESVGRV